MWSAISTKISNQQLENKQRMRNAEDKPLNDAVAARFDRWSNLRRLLFLETNHGELLTSDSVLKMIHGGSF